ncbi:MAG: ADP-ribosylglycohydrolase family protein [Clostridia bacterium]|nr:ADP-ribosylglycohydrolase family protein [Clostridia bacterium]
MNKNVIKLMCLVMAVCMLVCACGETATTATTAGVQTTTNASTSVGTTASTSGTTSTTKATTAATTTVKEPEKPLVEPYDGTLTDAELRDKILGGWIGQMAGVAFFAKSEFGWSGEIMTFTRLDKLYEEWNNGTVGINDAFDQDDTYVEIPFMDAMKENGALCDISYMAEKFKESSFALWHANKAGRDNLRAGLKWPDSGHYLYNKHCDDIDWQIECDFLGMMYPGFVNAAAERSFDIGHIMNYGDGVYGGVFVTAMHAAAFTADSIEEIVNAGLSVIPDDTTFKEAMNVVVDSYNAGDEWDECWQKLEVKYGTVDKCPEMSTKKYNIDAKLNAAYILVGLLWGKGDFEQTMVIAGRCGQDSDCNPSSAASILGNFYGASLIPEKWKKGLDYESRKFSATNYTLNDVVDLNVELMEQILEDQGATYKDGVWTIAKDTKYEQVEWEQWTDAFDAGLVVKNIGGGVVKFEIVTNGSDPVKTVKMEMPDGFVSDAALTYYNFPKTGEYTVKYTVESKGGVKVEKERTFTVEALISATPICTVTAPTGGGSKNIGVIFDGYVPYVTDTSSELQYDTYDGGKAKDSIYVGLEFEKTMTIAGVDFTEGKHFKDGGWFAEAPVIEVLVDGQWKAVETTLSRAYPTGNTLDAHGNNFDIYTFVFAEPVACDGVRLNGKPGGASYFISVGEITPLLASGAEMSFEGNDIPLIICSTMTPTGGGNKDIRVIADGKKGTYNGEQYDTYAGVRPGTVEYFGYLYKDAVTVTAIEYTEGTHGVDGGWFKNGEIAVEAYIDGEWKAVASDAATVYPNSNSKADFGNGFESYTFTLTTPVECNGIRLIGTTGGTSGWVAVSELTVITANAQ